MSALFAGRGLTRSVEATKDAAKLITEDRLDEALAKIHEAKTHLDTASENVKAQQRTEFQGRLT